MSFNAIQGDWTVCYDQTRNEDAKGRRSLMNKHPARRGPGCISQLVDSIYYYFEFYKTVGLGGGKEWSPPLPLKKQLVKIIIWK